MKEENIVEGLIKKDEACLKVMIALYGKLAYSVIYRFVSAVDPQVVEELTSDTFYDLWSKAEKIDLRRGSLKNLICLVARSKALNYLKSVNRKKPWLPLDDETADSPGPEMKLMEEESLQELLYLIREQKEPISSIFLLRYFYHASIPDIAAKLSMKRSQVDNYLSRGRKRLLEQIEKAQEEERG